MNKQTWLDRAEVIDAWRIVPRMLVVTFVFFTLYVVTQTLDWYQTLPAAERQLEASGFAFGVITAVSGLLTAVIKIYQTTGRHWSSDDKGEQ